MKTDQGRQGAVPALPARRHHRPVLRGGRGGQLRVRPLPRAPLQAGLLQALYHRRHDLPCPKVKDPAGAPDGSGCSGRQAQEVLIFASSTRFEFSPGGVPSGVSGSAEASSGSFRRFPVMAGPASRARPTPFFVGRRKCAQHTGAFRKDRYMTIRKGLCQSPER